MGRASALHTLALNLPRRSSSFAQTDFATPIILYSKAHLRTSLSLSPSPSFFLLHLVPFPSSMPRRTMGPSVSSSTIPFSTPIPPQSVLPPVLLHHGRPRGHFFRPTSSVLEPSILVFNRPAAISKFACQLAINYSRVFVTG